MSAGLGTHREQSSTVRRQHAMRGVGAPPARSDAAAAHATAVTEQRGSPHLSPACASAGGVFFGFFILLLYAAKVRRMLRVTIGTKSNDTRWLLLLVDPSVGRHPPHLVNTSEAWGSGAAGVRYGVGSRLCSTEKTHRKYGRSLGHHKRRPEPFIESAPNEGCKNPNHARGCLTALLALIARCILYTGTKRLPRLPRKRSTHSSHDLPLVRATRVSPSQEA